MVLKFTRGRKLHKLTEILPDAQVVNIFSFDLLRLKLDCSAHQKRQPDVPAIFQSHELLLVGTQQHREQASTCIGEPEGGEQHVRGHLLLCRSK